MSGEGENDGGGGHRDGMKSAVYLNLQGGNWIFKSPFSMDLCCFSNKRFERNPNVWERERKGGKMIVELFHKCIILRCRSVIDALLTGSLVIAEVCVLSINLHIWWRGNHANRSSWLNFWSEAAAAACRIRLTSKCVLRAICMCMSCG